MLEKTQENLSHLFAVGKCNFDVSPTAFQRGNSVDGRTATQTPHTSSLPPPPTTFMPSKSARNENERRSGKAEQSSAAQEEKRTQLRATISHHKTALSWKKRVVAQGSRLLTHHNVWWERRQGEGRVDSGGT